MKHRRRPHRGYVHGSTERLQHVIPARRRLTEQVLLRSAGMPELLLPAGAEVMCRLGSALGVLVTGQLRVSIGEVELSRLSLPGTFVGEVGAMLGTQLASSVTAVGPTTLRVLADPASFFREHPGLRRELGRQLASRLYLLSAHLPEQRQPLLSGSG